MEVNLNKHRWTPASFTRCKHRIRRPPNRHYRIAHGLCGGHAQRPPLSIDSGTFRRSTLSSSRLSLELTSLMAAAHASQQLSSLEPEPGIGAKSRTKKLVRTFHLVPAAICDPSRRRLPVGRLTRRSQLKMPRPCAEVKLHLRCPEVWNRSLRWYSGKP